RTTFTNADFQYEVTLKEIGVFATVDGKEETLFAYVNDGDGESFPPGDSGNIVERVRDSYVGVSTSLQVTATIDRSVIYATVFDLEEGLALKENKFDKNGAFNKNFGVASGDVLEGHRMAQSLGVEKFGGDVQTAGTKKVGYAYWCTVNKDMYICKVENSLNYIDASYFEAFSNNALLGKLNNLSDIGIFVAVKSSNDYSLDGHIYNSRVKIAETHQENIKILRTGSYHVTLSMDVGNVNAAPEFSSVSLRLNNAILESMRCDASGIAGVSLSTCAYFKEGDIISVTKTSGNLEVSRKRLTLILIP
ncbi:MAG: hypothetical protein ACRCZO_02675, partial [Cetobacterium sp.]